jgi:hypothetical protein
VSYNNVYIRMAPGQPRTSADTAGFALEQTAVLAAPATWVTNSASVADDGANKSVTLPATKPAQFFRLRRP